jgi:hypothetical protein
LLADANGNRYTPSFTVKKNRKYRYYVSQLAIKNPDLKFTGHDWDDCSLVFALPC